MSNEYQGGYTRRQELTCTEAQIATYADLVLHENEKIYVRMNSGVIRMKLGDGVTSLRDLPYTKVYDGDLATVEAWLDEHKTQVEAQIEGKIDKSNVAQGLGDSEEKVLSQKAATREFAEGVAWGAKDAVIDTTGYYHSLTATVNKFIKSVEYLGGIEGYVEGCIRVRQIMLFSTDNDVKRYINQFMPVINGVEGSIIHHDFYVKSTDGSDIVIENEILRVIYDGKALYNVSENAPYQYIVHGKYGNIFKVVTLSEFDFIDGEKIKNSTISEKKLADDLKDKINDVRKYSTLYKKNVVTLCDSLGVNTWQPKLVELTGCYFDEALNKDRYSYGGTATLNGSPYCAQARAKMLVEDAKITPDFIFIENVNDSSSNLGETSDEPFFLENPILLDTTPLATSEEATEYFNENFSTVVAGVIPAVGTRVGVPYTVTNSIKLTITSTPTASGNFGIRLNQTGGDTQYIAVTPNDSVEDVVDKIAEYAFNNYVVKKSGTDAVIFTPSGSWLSPSIAIVVGGTGITYTTETGITGTNYIYRYFLSHDTSNWSSASYWVETVTKMSAYKGLIEYLEKHFPKAQIVWLIPRTWNANLSNTSIYRADGSMNWDYIIKNNNYMANLFDKQTEFTKYYGIPIIDIRQDSCLNPGNLSTYMNSGNVHPKNIAYARWAEIISRYF